MVLLICSRSHSWCHIELWNSLPWSVWILTGHPNLVIQVSNSALATVQASLLGIVVADAYLEKPSCRVTMYFIPSGVSGMGPTRSM